MARPIICDRCGAPVGAAGFTVAKAVGDVQTEWSDHVVLGDFCSAACLAKAANEAAPKRPDFDGTRAMLEGIRG